MFKDLDALIRLTPQQYSDLVAENARYKSTLTELSYMSYPEYDREQYWDNQSNAVCSDFISRNIRLARRALKGE